MSAHARIGLVLSPQEALRGSDTCAPRIHISPERFSHPNSRTYQTICNALGRCVGMSNVSLVSARLETDDNDETRTIVTVAGTRLDGKIDATHVSVPWGAWDSEPRNNDASREWAHSTETIGRIAAQFCRTIPRTEFDEQRRYENCLVDSVHQYGVGPFVQSLSVPQASGNPPAVAAGWAATA